MAWWRADDEGVVVTLRVVAGARRSEVADASGDVLRLRVAAPAVEGRANAEVLRFVAVLFGARPSAARLLTGERRRDKVVRVDGVTGPPRG